MDRQVPMDRQGRVGGSHSARQPERGPREAGGVPQEAGDEGRELAEHRGADRIAREEPALGTAVERPGGAQQDAPRLPGRAGLREPERTFSFWLF